MAPIPVIGTEQFRCLSYKQQLEIVSLKLFDVEEYNRQAGIEVLKPDLLFELPPLPEVDLPDLPVVFLDNYWAGYSARYRAEWYGVDCPLTPFGVSEKRMVNICTFNFPMIGMLPAVYYVVDWLRNRYFTSHSVLSLIHACKVYIYMDNVLRGSHAHYLFSKYVEVKDKADPRLHTGPSQLYSDALDCLNDIITIGQMNSLQDTVQENKELIYLMQKQILVIHPQSRVMWGRRFFPLVPSDLYRDGRFHIYNWDWLQNRGNKCQ